MLITVIKILLFAKTHPRKWLHDAIASQLVEGEILIGPIIEDIGNERYNVFIEMESIIRPEKWIVECIESNLEDGESIKTISYST